jgi:hypothetical protein
MEVEVAKAFNLLKDDAFLPSLLVAAGEGVRSRLQDEGEDAEHR